MTDPVAAVVDAWAVRGRPLEVTGAATVVWEEGDGEPVVCLHGVPSSSFLYRKVLPELAAAGRRGIAFDLPGLGLAARPGTFTYTWSALAAWCEAAVDALGLDRLHLVVHDIGGPIGFDLARRVPERIRSLTVLNTLTHAATFRRPWVMEPFARRGIGRAYLATMSGFAFERLMRLQGVSGPVPAAELRAYVRLLKREDGGKAFLRIMRGFERTPEFEARTLGALRERRYPAAVAWGEDDPALPMDPYAEHARAALGVDTVHRLPGKHFVQEDSAPQIARLVASLGA